MTIFVFKFLFAGLQCYQISAMLKIIKFCIKLPILLNMILRSLLLLCNPAKNVGPARLYKRTSNWKYASNERTSNIKPKKPLLNYRSNRLERVHLLVKELEHTIFGFEHRTLNIVRPIITEYCFSSIVW